MSVRCTKRASSEGNRSWRVRCRVKCYTSAHKQDVHVPTFFLAVGKMRILSVLSLCYCETWKDKGVLKSARSTDVFAVRTKRTTDSRSTFCFASKCEAESLQRKVRFLARIWIQDNCVDQVAFVQGPTWPTQHLTPCCCKNLIRRCLAFHDSCKELEMRHFAVAEVSRKILQSDCWCFHKLFTLKRTFLCRLRYSTHTTPLLPRWVGAAKKSVDHTRHSLCKSSERPDPRLWGRDNQLSCNHLIFITFNCH